MLYSFIHNYRLRKLHENHFKLLDQRLEELNNKLVKLEKNLLALMQNYVNRLLVDLFPQNYGL